MNFVEGINWHDMFVPSVPVLETFIRGSLVYLGIFLLLRIILKRESSAVGVTDLLVVVLLADAAQNAMASGYKSITDGLLLVSTIIFWSYFLDWLGFKFTFFHKLIRPNKLLLVSSGRMLRRNMKKELISEDELMSEIRKQGIKDIKDVTEMYMEPNGTMSIISQKEQRRPVKKAGLFS